MSTISVVFIFKVLNENSVNYGIFNTLASIVIIVLSLKLANIFDEGRIDLSILASSISSIFLVSYVLLPGNFVFFLELLQRGISTFELGSYKILYDASRSIREILVGRSMLIELGRGVSCLILYLFADSFTKVFIVGSLLPVLYAISYYNTIKDFKRKTNL